MVLLKGVWPLEAYSVGFTATAFGTMVFVLVLTFPVKTYGKLLDKKEGTAFLTLPASTFEKFLSMLTIGAVVVPVIVISLFWGSDQLLSVIDKTYNPSYSISEFNSSFQENISNYVSSVNVYAILYLVLVALILYFLLCSILFKKARIGKGILIIIALLFFVGLYFESTGGHWNFLGSNLENLNAAELERRINLFLNLGFLMVFSILDVGIYLRLKTLKH